VSEALKADEAVGSMDATLAIAVVVSFWFLLAPATPGGFSSGGMFRIV